MRSNKCGDKGGATESHIGWGPLQGAEGETRWLELTVIFFLAKFTEFKKPLILGSTVRAERDTLLQEFGYRAKVVSG